MGLMHDTENRVNTAGRSVLAWLRKNLISLLALILILGISIGLFYFAWRSPDNFKQFTNYGYLGFFLVSLLTSITIFLPMPGILLVLPLVSTLNPLLLALSGAAGGTIGEISGYMAGLSGRGIALPGRTYQRIDGWMKKWGSWAVFIFAAVPFFPFDVAGLAAGAMRYPLWKFLLIGGAGKIIKYIVFVFAIDFGWDIIVGYLN